MNRQLFSITQTEIMKHQLINPAFKTLFILIVGVFLYSCQTNDGVDPGIPSDEDIMAFNFEVDELGAFEQATELAQPEKLKEDDPERDATDKSLECFTTYYKAAPGFDEMLSLDPTSDVIYPGALVKGESIPTGEYLPIVSDRDSITLSVSLENIDGSPVIKIGDPKLSTVREGINNLLNQEVNGATSAKINYEISQVYSKEQLDLAIGANYRSASSKVSSSFDFSSTQYENKFVFKFLQVYYTIDMDLPAAPSELFTELPDLAKLGSTSPVYVSTVTYGRMIIYTIESNYSKVEVDAAFSASFSSSDGTIDAKYEKVINSSSIKALVIGGSGSSAAQTVNGPQEVYNYISEGGNYSKDSPGAPLSYKLRYIKNNAVARVVLASEYFVRSCDLAYPVYEITLDRIYCGSCADGIDGDGEVYGKLWTYARVNGKQKGNKITWEKKSGSAISIKKKASYSIKKVITSELYRPNYDVDDVLFGGRMFEKDGVGNPDDKLGEISPGNTVRLKDIPYTGMEVSLKYSQVTVYFKLRRLK